MFERELKKYEFHNGFNQLIMEILVNNFKNIDQNLASQKQEIAKKITNLNSRSLTKPTI